MPFLNLAMRTSPASEDTMNRAARLDKRISGSGTNGKKGRALDNDRGALHTPRLKPL
jgi:hypothetical protein